MAQVFDVADYIVNSCQVDPLKLQKLLYYCQGVYMVLYNGNPLFEEPIEAWAYGPVVNAVYQRYKEYGFDFIPKTDRTPNLTAKEIEAIDMVLQYYGQMSAISLVGRTHSEKPWQQNYDPEKRHKEIPNSDIYEYFNETLEFS